MLVCCLLALTLILSVGLVGAQSDDLYALPAPTARVVASGSMASNINGSLLVATNMLSDSVSLVEPFQGERRDDEIPVGRDPRTIALTPDDQNAVVVNRGDGTISLINLDAHAVTATYPVGLLPYGVVTLDNEHAIVSLQGNHEIVIINLLSGEIIERISTPDNPTGLALWGSDYLYVTHLWSGEFSLIYLPLLSVVRTVDTGQDVALSQSVTVDPQRGLAYLPQTRLNTTRDAATYDTLLFPIVNVIDLRTMGLLRGQRIALDSADRPVNMPFAAALDSQKRWLYVANAGSDDVSVVDLTTGLGVSHIQSESNPRALLLTRDNGTLYVHNMIEGTVTFFDTRSFTEVDEVPINTASINADVLFGAEFFHTSVLNSLTTDNWISCASCHFDGQSDGRVWQSFAEGGRNTPTLFGLKETAPYTWTGAWDELADVEVKIRQIHAGTGLIQPVANDPRGEPNQGLSPDMESLIAYMLTFSGPPTPPTASPDLIAQGASIFEALDCATCHLGPAGTDGLTHDVGTNGIFETPSLRWLWMSAPYLHDGRAETLHDLFIMPGAHQLIRETPLSEIDALVAYLLSLPGE